MRINETVEQTRHDVTERMKRRELTLTESLSEEAEGRRQKKKTN